MVFFIAFTCMTAVATVPSFAPTSAPNADTPLTWRTRVMEAIQALEARVMELEVKASYSDDLLEQLNLTIYQQQRAIEQLTGHVQQLRQQGAANAEAGSTLAFAAAHLNERPPHY